jgi:hypothetical protein
MTEGIVISLEILVIEMGDRGSKSDLISKSVKEQRVDGSLVIYICINNYKVYSSRRESRFLEEIK